MNKTKKCKKALHKDSRYSIMGLYSKTIEELELKKKTELPIKKKQLEELIERSKLKIGRIEKLEINRQIEKLKIEIKDLENDKELTEYMLKASKYINLYDKESKKTEDELINSDSDNEENTNLKTFIKKKGSKKFGNIYKNFVEECENEIIIDNNASYVNNVIESCKSCGKESIVINNKEACASCTFCGYSFSYQDISNNDHWSEECEILSPFAYKRINHLKEWLSQLQAKETTEIPEEIINNLLLELKKERITKSDDITTSKIKGYLKKLKLNKYYEHVPSIINQLCGLPPPIMTAKLEQVLISKFKEIQAPFEKHVPEGRKNFLSYSYTLHKLCQLEGENTFLSCFPLLKSREKLYQQDCMWKKMCKELNWEFIPSV